jgi:hypothetical protein
LEDAAFGGYVSESQKVDRLRNRAIFSSSALVLIDDFIDAVGISEGSS